MIKIYNSFRISQIAKRGIYGESYIWIMTRLINIIHLPQREDRLLLVKDQLTQQNLQGCFWPGIPDIDNPKKGIAQAHKQVIKHAKQGNLHSVTIAEDDIKFTAPGAFDYFLEHEPAAFDLYLGGIYHGEIKPDNIVKDFAGLMLYTIHYRFYETFLSLPEENDIDRELAGRGKFVVCNPFVAIQHNGYSDNKKKYMDYDCCLQNRKLF
jgi:hypothetical protein